MEILDFLFSNIVFLVAIVWFLASIFGNKQKQERERNRHPRPVAKPIENREPRAQTREEPRPVSQPFELDLPWEKAQQEPAQNDIRQRTEELLAKAERIQSKERVQPRDRTPHRDRLRGQDPPLTAQSQSSQAEQAIDLSSLDRQRVVQGMVWSQVFGLPRAKEPHRPWPRYTNSRVR